MQGVHLRKYGVETKIDFELYEVDGVDLRTDAADAGSDCSIMKDEGAEATCTNDFVDEGKGYSITLDATEMQAARIVVYIVDSATKVWLDKVIVIETYGHASAQHAVDLDDGVRAGLTALPAAAADAAGGLPISDAGGLDIDAMNTAIVAVDTLTKASGDGDLAAILKDTGTDGVVLKAAGLNADAVAEIWAAAMTDLAAGAPAYNCSVLVAINYLFEAWRNKVQVTSSEIAVYKDDGSTKLTESDISDDGTTFEKDEYGAVD